MTRLLTDRQYGWGLQNARPVPLADMPDDLRHLWQALSPNPVVWIGELPNGTASNLVVIESAPRSQFSALLDALSAGRSLPSGSAAIALTGDEFKGQRDRRWVALEGNLHLCVYYRPGGPIVRLGAACTMLPAVAVVETLRTVCESGIEASIKWVNDVLVHGRKVAGVLTGTQTRGHVMEHVVFGVGINIAAVPALKAAGLGLSPGCLRDLAGPSDLSVGQVLFPLLQRIDVWYQRLLNEGPESLLEAYRSLSCVVGREVLIRDESGCSNGREEPWGALIASGRVEAIEPDLGLRIAGYPEPVRTGRLRFRTNSPAS